MDKEKQQGKVFGMPKRWQHVRPNSSQGTGASWSPQWKARGGTQVPTNSKENGILSECSSVTLFTGRFHRQNHYRLDRCGKEEVPIFEVDSTTRSFSSRPHWQAIYLVFAIEFANGMKLKIRHLHREQGKTEQIDLEPEQLTLIIQTQQTMAQARRDSVLLTENQETMIRKASAQAVFARTVENGKFYNTLTAGEGHAYGASL